MLVGLVDQVKSWAIGVVESEYLFVGDGHEHIFPHNAAVRFGSRCIYIVTSESRQLSAFRMAHLHADHRGFCAARRQVRSTLPVPISPPAPSGSYRMCTTTKTPAPFYGFLAR
jgi:hypothetical protein